MSLLDTMRAEREANAAKATARVRSLLGGSSPATTLDNADLSPNAHHGHPLVTTCDNQKLSPVEHNSAPLATTCETQKLSQGSPLAVPSETTTKITRLPQNLQSQDGKRLARLLDHYQRGRGLRPATEQAVELSIAFGVSLRTAQRHIKQGTLPAKERRLGADGKRRPLGHAGRVRSPSERELMRARRALTRAVHSLATAGLQGREGELLQQIQVLVTKLQNGARAQSPNQPRVAAKPGA